MTIIRKEVEIKLGELRRATLAIIEASAPLPALVDMSEEKFPLIHAYLLGVVMRSCELTPESLESLFDLIQLGYDDFEAIRLKALEEGGIN